MRRRTALDERRLWREAFVDLNLGEDVAANEFIVPLVSVVEMRKMPTTLELEGGGSVKVSEAR